MTDRELLELAAKAAGYDVEWATWVYANKAADGCCFKHRGTYDYWNPLADDGDALRLAVILGLVVDCSRPSAGEPYKQHAIWLDETCDNATLTRRAIVRAAAEIGKAMP
jgi:hypothetical protein